MPVLITTLGRLGIWGFRGSVPPGAYAALASSHPRSWLRKPRLPWGVGSGLRDSRRHHSRDRPIQSPRLVSCPNS